MDVIRSAYRGKMRFREGDAPVNVTWFFADPDAKVFEAPTIFRGSDFESTPFQNNGLGEQRPPRGPWRNGKRPAALRGDKDHAHFPLDWWENGIPATETVTFQRTVAGEPTVCLLPVFGARASGEAVVRKGNFRVGLGGALVGGTAVVSHS